MADFTGLNPEQAKNDIAIFEGAGMQVYNIVRNANIDFVTNLSAKWHSDRATQFAADALPKVYEAQYNILQFVNNIVIKAVAAYNSMADSQGVAKISTDKIEMPAEANLPTDTIADFQIDGKTAFTDQFPDGRVGMYVDDVKNTIVPDLTNAISNAKDVYLDRVPDTISMYDPGNEIKTAYADGIKKAKEALEAELTAVYNGINAAVEAEVNLSEAGARAAADVLSSGQQG